MGRMSLIKIINYSTPSNKEPLTDWFDDLDFKTQSVVIERMARVRLGNFGDCKYIKNGDGIWELRIDYGPGYRIYFGKQKTTIIILLLGGDKKSQSRDITKAKRYWLEYKESLHE